MYKVFFYDKVLFLADAWPQTAVSEKIEYIDLVNSQGIEVAVKQFIDDENKKQYIFYHTDMEYLRKKFFSLFYPVIAAGGVVENEQGEFLFIYRRGKWDLPKGKVDDNEKVTSAARREVMEETGLKQVDIDKLIKPTYHIYYRNNRYNLKTTYWYHMKTKNNEMLIPQQEEDIEKAVWVKSDEIRSYAEKSFESIRELLLYFFKDKI